MGGGGGGKCTQFVHGREIWGLSFQRPRATQAAVDLPESVSKS